MAVLEIEPETSDPKASQPLATLAPDAQFSTAWTSDIFVQQFILVIVIIQFGS